VSCFFETTPSLHEAETPMLAAEFDTPLTAQDDSHEEEAHADLSGVVADEDVDASFSLQVPGFWG